MLANWDSAHLKAWQILSITVPLLSQYLEQNQFFLSTAITSDKLYNPIWVSSLHKRWFENLLLMNFELMVHNVGAQSSISKRSQSSFDTVSLLDRTVNRNIYNTEKWSVLATYAMHEASLIQNDSDPACLMKRTSLQGRAQGSFLLEPNTGPTCLYVAIFEQIICTIVMNSCNISWDEISMGKSWIKRLM